MVRSEFTYRASKRLAWAVTVAHVGASVIWIVCPMLLVAKIIGIAVLIFSFFQIFGTYIRPLFVSSSSQLIQSTDGSWRMWENGRRMTDNLTLVGWIAHRWLVIVRLVDRSQKKINIVLLPDSADRETMRRVRVSLLGSCN